MPSVSVRRLMDALRADAALAGTFDRWEAVAAHCLAYRTRTMSSRDFADGLCALLGKEAVARAVAVAQGEEHAPRFLRELERNTARKRRFEALGLEAWHDLPADFQCPITRETFVDPVVASDGHTYERHALERLFASGDLKSPLTRAVLVPLCFPNHALKKRMHAYRDETLAAVERVLARPAAPTTCTGEA